jgi:hypothetical protein
LSQRQPIFNAKPTMAIAFFHRIRRNVQPAGACGGERGARVPPRRQERRTFTSAGQASLENALKANPKKRRCTV